MSPFSKTLLDAAELCRHRALEIEQAIKEYADHIPKPIANDGFSLDDLFLALVDRNRSPKIIFAKDKIDAPTWKLEYLLEAHVGVECAFTQAGLIVGSNVPGQKKILEEKRDALSDIIAALKVLGFEGKEFPDKMFAAKFNSLFIKGPLPNRRPERISTLFNLNDTLKESFPHLIQLVKWLNEDISILSSMANGRPSDLEKQAFVREMGNLWTRLANTTPSKQENSVFGLLVADVWDKCVPDEKLGDSFARALRSQRDDKTSKK